MNIKDLDLNKINIDKMSYKSIVIYCIGYVTVKDLSYVTLNTLDESKDTLKKYQELWDKIRNVINMVITQTIIMRNI